jgi:hypothetical protein
MDKDARLWSGELREESASARSAHPAIPRHTAVLFVFLAPERVQGNEVDLSTPRPR